ncbi:MAG: helicase-exonuclease AddAB subunit AddA [Ruminococcaceae bacterium]|nr:helicase-exonuclease AddAB subunit AddA [Oscillospiraceae bacterium]
MGKLTLTAQQQSVVENRGGSLLVSAAAGSGKTKVLVERLFRYITREHCNIDDFLIITFTKAAAAELRSKIASELSKLLAENPADQHLKRQLLRVYQADIKTVDSFCAALLRENTHLLVREGESHSLTPDFRTLEENEAKLLRQKVLDRTLDGFYEDMTPGAMQLADTLGAGRDDRSLETLVLDLYQKLQSHAYPEQWLEENCRMWQSLGDSFDDTPYAAELMQTVRRQSRHWEQALCRSAEQAESDTPLYDGYGTKFLAAAEGFRHLAAAWDWESARTAAVLVEFPRLNTPKGRKDDPDVVAMKKVWEGAKESIKNLRKKLDISSAEIMEDLRAVAPAMVALLRLTAAFNADYQQEKLRMNTADFSDQEHLALRLLVLEDGTPTALGEQVSARYQEILVDEYQDTNEVQNAIFRAVSREGKNIFTVGDVKQSIYRFRLADPTIFLEKYERFKLWEQAEDGEERKILLTRNFRSRREILDATNFVFENILSPEMGDMEYGENEALYFGAEYYPPRQDCETEFHLISAQRKSKANPQPVRKLQAEARFVAERIDDLLRRGYPVTGEDGSLRPCRPEDIVILMRAPGSRSAAFAEALAEREIPCSFEQSEDFFNSMEIAVMLSLLEIVDNPRQDVPLISVLRSPVFGFTADRLAQLRGATPEGDFYDAVAADGGQDCKDFLQLLRGLRLAARDMSVCRLIWHIYNTLNILGIFGALDSGAERRENLIAFSRYAETFEGSGYKGLFLFVMQLRRLLEAGQTPGIKGASTVNGVRMMTIHKSKGLEFPIVILADLDHNFSGQDFKSAVLVHPEMGLGPQCVDLKRKIQYPTMARLAVGEKLRRENLAEEQRLLYVAMTRPKEKLILVASMHTAEKRLQRLAAAASCPVFPESVAAGKCFADWLLMPLLCRVEAAELRDFAGVEATGTYGGDTKPWKVFLHNSETYRQSPCGAVSVQEEAAEEAPFDPSILEFVYPYARESRLPAKVTATQLKGRAMDQEIAENTVRMPYLRPLSQPRFRQASHGLTAAERGTATHLVLQYLDFENRNVAEQVERLRLRGLLTEQQADAVDTAALERFLASPLAEEIRTGSHVLREYRFALLLDAAAYEPEATAGDSILLQGVVDCCFETAEGITVVDFKTDRVQPGQETAERAEHYRPQLEAYSRALEQVLEKRVVRRVLYFLHSGETVDV